MGRQAPAPPPDWADKRLENQAARKADPAPQSQRGVSHVRSRYRITGRRAVFGFEPGTVAELDLTSDQAAALIESGHIEPVTVGRLPVIQEESHG